MTPVSNVPATMQLSSCCKTGYVLNGASASWPTAILSRSSWRRLSTRKSCGSWDRAAAGTTRNTHAGILTWYADILTISSRYLTTAQLLTTWLLLLNDWQPAPSHQRKYWYSMREMNTQPTDCFI